MPGHQKYDLYSQSFKANAHEVYALMRHEDPVFQQPGLDGKTMIWFVTRYTDVEAILHDDKRFVLNPRQALTPEQLASFPPDPPILDLVNNHLLTKDGEDHRRLRALVNKAFTPHIVHALRGRIQSIADELLDRVQEQYAMDLVDDYAFPLPITVIAELIGIPSEHRDQFRVWSDAFVTPDLSEGGEERFTRLMAEFTAYLRRLFEQRRQDPKDDLLTGLLRAEEAGDCLTEQELFSMIILLIVAGHETTVGLISNAVLALLQNPDRLEELRKDPGRILLAVEELLRYDGPVERSITRWVAVDVELGGQHLRRGDLVIAVLAAANRDPAQFSNPDTLDISRVPNRHLGFGRGAHYCLGAPLARMEGEIALNTLFRRMPGLRLAVPVSALEWRLIPIFHAPRTLPIAWD